MMDKLTNDDLNISKELHWFMETLLTDFGVESTAEGIGVEAAELGLDEVDDAYNPKELFEIVPTALLYEIMVFDDEQDNLWVGGVAFYPNTPNWCLQVIMKNDKVVFRKVLSFFN